MADDSILHYLPKGWTEERYKNATDDDWDSLTEEEAEKMMQRGAAESQIQSAKNMAEINEQRAARGAPPKELPKESESTYPNRIHELVELVERQGYEDFGFLMFRTHYENEALWKRFHEEYEPVLTEAIDRMPPSSGIERIRDKLYMKIVDDDALVNSGPEQVALGYCMFEEEDDIEPGLQTKMCLMVDEECMKSVTEKRAEVPPFVKAVDVMAGDRQKTYPGFFKVAISSLVTGFYLALARCNDPAELYPGTDKIWSDNE